MLTNNTNIKDLATYTVISFCAGSSLVYGNNQLNDIYKVSISQPSNFIQCEQAYNIPTLAFPKYIQSTLPAPLTNNIGDDFSVLFNKAGIDFSIGNELLEMAKGILAEASYTDISITPDLSDDPDENSMLLTFSIYIKATFEESLAIDTLLTRELIKRVGNLPENLSMIVHDLG
jgi:hypothetical protein